jgi:hypothetical protein
MVLRGRAEACRGAGGEHAAALNLRQARGGQDHPADRQVLARLGAGRRCGDGKGGRRGGGSGDGERKVAHGAAVPFPGQAGER